MLACTHPAFDGPVILFQDLIKTLHRSMSTLLFQNTAGLELNDGRRISSVLVGVDDPRRGTVLPVAPVESTARHKYTHLPFTRTYVSSTPPRVVCCLEPFAQAPIQLRAYRWTQRQTVT
jgi:hypothetical protein